MRFKFGIVGLGSVAKVHAEALKDIKDAELVSCYHKNGEKADNFASLYGAKGYSNLDEFLSSGIDVLVITTPSAVRCEYAIPAMERGINVLIEKPMDIKSEKAEEMIRLSKEKGVLLGVIFQNRFSSLNLEIKKAVDSARLGKRILSSCYVKWYRSQEYYDSGAWRGTKEIDGGGCLINQAIHGLDLLLSLSPDLKEVFSFSALLNHERIDVEDTISSTLRFEDGSLGAFEASTAAYPGSARRIELIGSDGTIVAEDDHLVTWSFKEKREEDDEIIRKYSHLSASATNTPQVDKENHKREYLDYIEALKGNKKLIVDGAEGLKSLKAVEAMYKSAESGTKVSL